MTAKPSQKPNVDLEELRFLISLWETQSLTTAAERQKLSMGAASRRLTHLRETFRDELFIRSGLVMLPTNRMRELQPRVVQLLSASEQMFEAESFDLKNTRRTVRILSVDNGVMTLMNEAIGHFYREASNASIAVSSVDEYLFDKLRNGSADLALYPIKEVPKDCRVLELYKTRRGILVREGHPLIELYNKKGVVTPEDLAQFRKVQISFAGAPQWRKSPTEVALDSIQPAAFSMPYFLAVPFVLAQTNFTYMAPVITLMHFVRTSAQQLRMLPTPPGFSLFTPCLIWHQSTHADPFLQWVRGVIVTASRAEATRLGAIID